MEIIQKLTEMHLIQTLVGIFTLGLHIRKWRARRKMSGIPKVIHKVLINHSMSLNIDNLDAHTKEAHDSWRSMNPNYELRYYSGEDCRDYLKKHYGERHLLVFDSLKPYSSKANFFRYCLLYREGGVYSDWKQVCLRPLDEYVPPGLRWFSNWDINEHLMQTAFFGCCPRNPVLRSAIEQCIENVLREEYGRTPLWTTGPYVLGTAYKRHHPSTQWGQQIYTSRTMIERSVHDGSYHRFRFSDSPVVLHKHKKLSQDQNWESGNNYVRMWMDRDVYDKGLVRKLRGELDSHGGAFELLVINLLRNKDRLNNFLKYYETMHHKIPYHRVEAVDGWAMMHTPEFRRWDELLTRNGYVHPKHTLRTHQGYKGVQMSLIKCLRFAKTLKSDWAIVCEDDCELPATIDFAKIARTYPDSKVIYLDNRNSGGDGHVPVACMSCVMYHRSVFDIFIKEMDPFKSKHFHKFPKHTPNIYDWYTHWLIKHALKIKASSHPIVGSGGFKSTVQVSAAPSCKK